MTTIVLIGTLDTKGAEYEYLRERVRSLGAHTVLVDVGTGGPPTVGSDVAARQGADRALRDGLRESLGPTVEVHQMDTDINDETFALAAANRLHELITAEKP
jgi:uncharacterized protein (UPF0261 family)